jgi:hypothetical protein
VGTGIEPAPTDAVATEVVGASNLFAELVVRPPVLREAPCIFKTESWLRENAGGLARWAKWRKRPEDAEAIEREVLHPPVRKGDPIEIAWRDFKSGET